MSGMAQIRKTRGVPARRGMRVRYTGDKRGAVMGTILSAKGGYLRILLDGDKYPKPFHPTWELEYLESRQDFPVQGERPGK